jgi:aconitate hydratase
MLLGVKAVLAVSYERIHRSNLIGMGVLPLQFTKGEDAESLGLTGKETYDIEGHQDPDAREVSVIATQDGGKQILFKALIRIDTPKERDYFEHGGILQYVLRQLVKAA